jgi:tetratricopeptide (TPR) repeat protein
MIVIDLMIKLIEQQITDQQDHCVTFESNDHRQLAMHDVVVLRNHLYQHQHRFPHIAILHYFWGKLEKQLKMPEPAIQCFRNALAVDPNHIESLREMGFLMAESGQLDQAMGYFERITQLSPNDWMAWNDGGCSLRAMRQNGQALSWMRAAFSANPTSAMLAANIALLEYETHDYVSAQASLDQAFAIDPVCAEALHTQAMLFASLGKHELSYEYDLKALSVKPDYPQVRLGLALTALMLGRWEEGFAGYEHRWAGSDKADTNKLPTVGRPQWLGQQVYPSSSIVILPEQGFGDMIQVSRLLPVLKQRFHHVEWRVPLEMLRLMAFNFAQENLIVDNQMDTLDVRKLDYELPIMSLPFALRVTPANVPTQAKYLSVPDTAYQKFVPLLSGAKRMKVGLVWTGKATLGKQALRMVPTELLSLLDHPDVTFVSLQKFDRQDVVHPNFSDFMDCMDACHDFMDTAALIEHLDLVIAVDTSVAHLSAALGKPTWLLNRLGSEWRWMHNQTSSSWYPTMTIYNQQTLNDWTDVLVQIKSDLLNFINSVEFYHV